EAQSWAEDHLTGEEYEEIFGAVAEDDTRVSVSYSLNASTFDRIKRLAQERATSQVAIVQELLDKALGQ
ncbi:MAG: hypothetical protein RSB86_18240, partial [Comamonas sp.]|uniref:hypothetical protein n=1 Tax=Comamonas sp. TaxID=34028 RepID=UPI002FC5B8E6